MIEKRKSDIASLTLALVAVAWGTSYAIVKDNLDLVEPMTLMAIRFVASSVLLTIIYIKRMVKVKKHEIKQGSVIGIFMFLAYATMVIGLQYTTASKQSFLIGAYVVFVPFLAWLINKKRPDRYDGIGAAMAITGLGMLTLGGVSGINIGDLISLFCSLCYAMHMITIERYCKDTDPIILTIVQLWTGAIIFTAIALLTESHDLSIIQVAPGPVLYLIIVTTVIPFVVQNVAQKYISSTTTALILTLESVVGSIFAVVYLGEAMSFVMALGCVIVFAGIIIQETKLGFLKKKNIAGGE